MEPSAPTSVDLASQRQQEWARASQAVEARLKERAAQLAQSPDWLMRPTPDADWSSPGIVHRCGGTVFRIAEGRWVCVNGRKHRAELTCQTCQQRGTWDWATLAWID